MAHGKGSTKYSNDVLDMVKMAAFLQKVPAAASLTNTSRRAKGKDGEDGTQSLQHKQGGSGGIGGVG